MASSQIIYLFNKQDLEFIEALANQAAIAIDNAKLYELATKDGLTKLYIYRHFYTLLENEIKRSSRYNHEMTLLMMDIDNFKSVNDTYGHAAGDIILKKVANLLTNAFRTVDYICRIGGDEFAVIMVQMTSDLSYTITQKIAEINRLLANPEDGTPAVSLSVGVAFTDRQNPGNSLFKDADIALYYTKEHGRNGCHFYPII